MKNLLTAVLMCAVAAVCASCQTQNQRQSDTRATDNIPAWAKPLLSKEQIETAKKEGVAPAIEVPLDKDGKINMKMVFIPPGEFLMGSANIEKSRYSLDKERPQHKVIIKEGFYISRTEITQAQWMAVMGNNPSWFKNGANNSSKDTSNYPVETITWNDAQLFIKTLNTKINNQGFRLPSEAEWEYACRAGTTDRFYFGEDENLLFEYCNYADKNYLSPYSDKGHDDGYKSLSPVAQYKANKWGLFDMLGNIWEFCEDDYHKGYNLAPNNGGSWSDSPRTKDRVARGGGWNSHFLECRNASRTSCEVGKKLSIYGFRIVKNLK